MVIHSFVLSKYSICTTFHIINTSINIYHHSFYIPFPEHHVHFDQASLKDEFETENCVTYQKAGDDCVVVHLGFLQVNHRYLIDLRLPSSLYKANGDEPVKLVPDNNSIPNIHCKVVASGNDLEAYHAVPTDEANSKQADQNADQKATEKATEKGTEKGAEKGAEKPVEEEDYHYIKVEYFAHREKLLREELKLINSKNAEELLKLVITARVLGKGKGTPMLRNGIHCLGFEGDEESSEASDAPCGSTSGASH